MSSPSSAPRPAAAASTTRGRRAKRMNGDDREAAILEAAEQLLATHGLHELSIDQIARGAGISRSSFYFYFPSKEAVLLSLMDRVISQANARRDEALMAADPEPASLVRAGITAFYETFREHRAVALAAADSRITNPEAAALWSRVMDGWVGMTAAAIAYQQELGNVPPSAVPARDLMTALNLMNERVLHATFAQDAPFLDESTVVDTLVAVWLAAILGTAPGPAPDHAAAERTTPERS